MTQISKEAIQALLLRNDDIGMNAVGRALVALNRRQTSVERSIQATTVHNAQGFTPSDARIGTSMAEFYAKAGKLTPKQVAYWQESRTPSGRPRIVKYWKQLIEVANEKQARKQAQLVASLVLRS